MRAKPVTFLVGAVASFLFVVLASGPALAQDETKHTGGCCRGISSSLGMPGTPGRENNDREFGCISNPGKTILLKSGIGPVDALFFPPESSALSKFLALMNDVYGVRVFVCFWDSPEKNAFCSPQLPIALNLRMEQLGVLDVFLKAECTVAYSTGVPQALVDEAKNSGREGSYVLSGIVGICAHEWAHAAQFKYGSKYRLRVPGDGSVHLLSHFC
ncbi:MAG: hypothetical protein HY719_03595 [Planctomycetes bacterium]|nr:hypothetical protein [Planctomycetota bacterium]